MRMVSYSELTTFKRCPKRWDYAYRQGYRAIRKARGLDIGFVWGQLVAAYWKQAPLDPILDTWRMQAEDDDGVDLEHWTKDRYDLVVWLLERYRKANDRDLGDVEVLGTEVPFRVRLPHPHGLPSRFGLKGFVDLLVRYLERTWLWEVKTMGQWGPDAMADTDPQISTYAWGLAYAPGGPALPLHGMVLDATKTYRWRDYRPLTDSFRRVFVDRTEAQLLVHAWDSYETAQQIDTGRRAGRFPRTIVQMGPMACSNCAFFHPCFEALKGYSETEQAMLAEDFTKERLDGNPRST